MKTRCIRELVWVFLLTAALAACGGGGGGAVLPPAAHQTSVKLAQTGQTASYDVNTVKADDGALKLGVAWPSPRFMPISAGTGTVITDNLTGLMWAGDPTLSSLCSAGTTTTWQGALDYVVCLNSKTYLSHADWRLPNRKELRSLINYGQANTAAWLNTPGVGNPGFSNVQADYYWSSTTYAGVTSNAWGVGMGGGSVYGGGKSSGSYVWPVRSGQ